MTVLLVKKMCGQCLVAYFARCERTVHVRPILIKEKREDCYLCGMEDALFEVSEKQ